MNTMLINNIICPTTTISYTDNINIEDIIVPPHKFLQIVLNNINLKFK